MKSSRDSQICLKEEELEKCNQSGGRKFMFHVVVGNINNENITYMTEGFVFYIETFFHTTIYLKTSTGTELTTEPTPDKKQNNKTKSKQLPKKNDNVEESVTEDEDDGSGTGETREYTPREIQMFSRKDSDNTKKRDIRPESRRDCRIVYRIK